MLRLKRKKAWLAIAMAFILVISATNVKPGSGNQNGDDDDGWYIASVTEQIKM